MMTLGGVLSALAACISVLNHGSSSPSISLAELLPAFADGRIQTVVATPQWRRLR